MKLFYNIILLILLIGSVSASLGTFKQNDCIQIKTILNATWVNISTISIPPNNTIYISNKAMTKIGQTFYYNFCNTSELGTYIYDYWDNTGEVYVNSFEITPSGTPAGAMQSFTVPILLYLTSIAFLVTGIIFDNRRWLIKSALFLISLLFLIMVINIAMDISTTNKEQKMAFAAFVTAIASAMFIFIYILVYYFKALINQLKDRDSKAKEDLI